MGCDGWMVKSSADGGIHIRFKNKTPVLRERATYGRTQLNVFRADREGVNSEPQKKETGKNVKYTNAFIRMALFCLYEVESRQSEWNTTYFDRFS